MISLSGQWASTGSQRCVKLCLCLFLNALVRSGHLPLRQGGHVVSALAFFVGIGPQTAIFLVELMSRGNSSPAGIQQNDGLAGCLQNVASFSSFPLRSARQVSSVGASGEPMRNFTGDVARTRSLASFFAFQSPPPSFTQFTRRGRTKSRRQSTAYVQPASTFGGQLLLSLAVPCLVVFGVASG